MNKMIKDTEGDEWEEVDLKQVFPFLPPLMAYTKKTNQEENNMTTTIKPLGDNILVKRIEPEEIRKGSILLAQTNKQPGDRARAIAVGPGRNNIMPIAVGDELIIERFPHKTVVLDDVEYCFVSVSDVVAVVV